MDDEEDQEDVDEESDLLDDLKHLVRHHPANLSDLVAKHSATPCRPVPTDPDEWTEVKRKQPKPRQVIRTPDPLPSKGATKGKGKGFEKGMGKGPAKGQAPVPGQKGHGRSQGKGKQTVAPRDGAPKGLLTAQPVNKTWHMQFRSSTVVSTMDKLEAACAAKASVLFAPEDKPTREEGCALLLGQSNAKVTIAFTDPAWKMPVEMSFPKCVLQQHETALKPNGKPCAVLFAALAAGAPTPQVTPALPALKRQRGKTLVLRWIADRRFKPVLESLRAVGSPHLTPLCLCACLTVADGSYNLGLLMFTKA